MRERKVDKPFNFGYTIMNNEYPKELHNCLKVPGIFRKKVNNKVYLKDGIMGEMDSSYIVDPDYKQIFEPMVANGEHQSTPVDENKIRMISKYGIQQIHDENMPQFSFVASHIPKEKHVQSHCRSLSDIVRPYFLDLGEEDNKKRLSMVKNILKEQGTFSNEDALNLGIIALFAPRNIACEVTEEVVEIYAEISGQLSAKMEFTLYSVLRAMVDAYFDDEEDFNRVMTIMNENTTEGTVEKIESLDFFKNKVKEVEEINIRANDRISKLEAVNHNANDRISKLEAVNHNANDRISQLEEANSTLQEEIFRLKKQLASK